jgi:penicillin-insensitive murein endopeptidase
MRLTRLVVGLAALAAVSAAAGAQDLGTLTPRPLPPLAHPDDPKTPAKQLFGRVTTPAPLPTHVYGFYSHGCLAGARQLPFDGPDWQVMRPSRDRNWGHPALIAFLERFARHVATTSHWPGILVGDMAQPRGGPMLNGHASHQLGLDADVWFRAMPRERLSRADRETMMSTQLVRSDRLDVDAAKWSSDDIAVLKAAATDPVVERIFVNAAIKKALCRDTQGDRSWLGKIRPMYGHDYHFHIRIACPAGETACEAQKPVTGAIDCADSDLAYWFRPGIIHPRPAPPPKKPPPELTMSALPAACREVLNAR